MFQKDDVVVYGSAGMCRVTDVTEKTFPGAAPRTYYVLSPLYTGGTVYAPAEGGKVFMRHAVNADEANALIDSMPQVEPQVFHSRSVQELEHHYSASFQSHDVTDLVCLIVSIDQKKQEAIEARRKLGLVDERYMKRAETLLYEELAYALGLMPQDIPAYIGGRIGNALSV